jgi:hypothetical protein
VTATVASRRDNAHLHQPAQRRAQPRQHMPPSRRNTRLQSAGQSWRARPPVNVNPGARRSISTGQAAASLPVICLAGPSRVSWPSPVGSSAVTRG